jgi:hypothetical protein
VPAAAAAAAAAAALLLELSWCCALCLKFTFFIPFDYILYVQF